MGNIHQVHCRRMGMMSAIEVVRNAREGGITATELADELCVSKTTAKSYLNAMAKGSIVSITKEKVNLGGVANLATMIAGQDEIDAFLASDLVSKKTTEGPQKKRSTAKARVFKNCMLAVEKVAPKIRAYTDLPREFFGQVVSA